MTSPASRDMLRRLLSPVDQSAAARSVEIFGWICLAEALVVMISPGFVASVLHIAPLGDQAESYFRLAALLVGGVGMLYIASGRLNSAEFVFASLLDRPLVPPVMALLWYIGIIPGPLALAFALQDFSGFLWTLRAWRAQHGAMALAR